MGEIDLLARGRPVRLPWDRSWTLTLRPHAPLFYCDLHRAFESGVRQASCHAGLARETHLCRLFRGRGCVAGPSVWRHNGTGPREVTLRAWAYLTWR